MAYTNLAIQPITRSGLKPTYTSATLTDGEMWSNTGTEFIHIINGGGSACVVTLVTPATISGLAIEDKTVSVPAGERHMIGPFDPSLYNNPNGETDPGKMYVTYDQTTSVTVAVVRL